MPKIRPMPADRTLIDNLFRIVRREQEKHNVKPKDKENVPKDMPGMSSNQDDTDLDYPLRGVMPNDRGWSAADLFCGSGDGPPIGPDESMGTY